MRRRAARVDGNHAAVVAALRAIGCLVQSLAAVGDGVPDLLVLSPFTSKLHLLEVKDGERAKTDKRARQLTERERVFADTWGCIVVVESVEQAINAVRSGVLSRPDLSEVQEGRTSEAK